MYEHTIIARQVNGIMVGKATIKTKLSCGMKAAANEEINQFLCNNFGKSELRLSFLLGSTKKLEA